MFTGTWTYKGFNGIFASFDRSNGKLYLEAGSDAPKRSNNIAFKVLSGKNAGTYTYKIWMNSECIVKVPILPISATLSRYQIDIYENPLDPGHP